MNSDQEGLVVSFALGIVLGAIIGTGVGLLASPQSGKLPRLTVTRRARRVQAAASGSLDHLAPT
ncbi:MAG: YtxH domain-containing protein [Longimicrobiales bacterium]|nr:YtxH domain-containing protein [Longimicrobiales bacterium]